jgi:plastocyanin
MMRHGLKCTGVLAVFLAIAACGGEKHDQESHDVGAPGGVASAVTPAPGRRFLTVEAETDEAGNNKFSPSEVHAQQGDVIRYTLKLGVHNVHFLPDSNPGKKGLPPASDMLQLPGQTIDILVSFEPGTYYFQCDPHAALGMHGHLIVTP